MPTTENILRRCIIRPYRKGAGPTFRIVTWDTGRTHRSGRQWCIGYRLTMHTVYGEPNRALRHATCDNVTFLRDGRHVSCRTVLFEGEDFGCSPMHAIDSDECIRSLMAFLTLRPGDTDSEYFEDYTPEQLDYCDQHAEALACECMRRFGEDN